MKYRLSLSLIVATSLHTDITTVAYAQEDNGKQTAEKDKKENTSKPIDFDKAQKISPQALKDQLTPEDLRLHNKVAET